VRAVIVIAAGLLSAAIAAVAVLAAPEASPSPIDIAITFDDLPVHDSLPKGMSRTDVARRIIATLKAYHAPPIFGFANAHDLMEEPDSAEVLRLWRAAGFPIGNHTYSHPDANTVSAKAFEQDVLANEPLLRHYMSGEDWHWLRLPYLHEGDTAEKRDAIAGFLKAHHYQIAQVSLSFDDYAYNDPYARCLAKGDKRMVRWLKQSYLDRASVDILAAQKMSQLLYGRDIKYILLLHIGAFDAVMLPRLLAMYERRGVKLISLAEAQSDPAYQNTAEQQFDWGGTMLTEQMVARNIPIPDFANSDDALDRIDALCQ
jgi:peptidoglycan-N-acetylglucosamine deacetylase